MTLIFDSLDSLLTGLRDRKVQVVRHLAGDLSGNAPAHGVPHLTSRVIVTAALTEQLWAEWRYRVGRGLAEIGDKGLHLPEALRMKANARMAGRGLRGEG
jgi:hypothetical protein